MLPLPLKGGIGGWKTAKTWRQGDFRDNSINLSENKKRMWRQAFACGVNESKKNFMSTRVRFFDTTPSPLTPPPPPMTRHPWNNQAKLRGTYYENTRLKGFSLGKAQASSF
jgi:hypothetical protein